ncbi:hypothetical protein WG936_05410 [Corynebacterium sp. H127]|uniref:hypothetical protein n=1 Tax=Corynebacterium sp. H127 TaxID=3133418 RepID=UPI0030AEECA4
MTDIDKAAKEITLETLDGGAIGNDEGNYWVYLKNGQAEINGPSPDGKTIPIITFGSLDDLKEAAAKLTALAIYWEAQK